MVKLFVVASDTRSSPMDSPKPNLSLPTVLPFRSSTPPISQQKSLSQPRKVVKGSHLRMEQNMERDDEPDSAAGHELHGPTPSSSRADASFDTIPTNPSSDQASKASPMIPYTLPNPSIQLETTHGSLAQVLLGGDTGQDSEELLELPTRRKISNMAGPLTPSGRRSVQFAQQTANQDPAGATHSRSNSWDMEGADTPIRDRRGASLLSKLRHLTSSSANTHVRSPSGHTIGGDSIDERSGTGVFSPDSEAHPSQLESSQQGFDSETDADGEDSSPEESADQPNSSSRRRRKSRRPLDGGAQTAPVTPKTPFMRDGRPNLFSLSSNTLADRHFRPQFLTRRATTTDLPTDERQGVSEDEGRERLARGSPWRRDHGARGLSYSGRTKAILQPGNEPPRSSTFRRAFTGFGGLAEAPDTPFSPWRRSGDRTTSLSAAKWRNIKAGLKMIGRQRKIENTVDQTKSAELLAELTAGVPAALMLASMFQRDEHGHKRIPVLMEQLKVQLSKIEKPDHTSSDRQLDWRISLEYGNGLLRQKWFVDRTLRDFSNLHARYKLQGAEKKIKMQGGEKNRAKLPRFPKSAFPYLRGIRGLESESEGEEEAEKELTAPSGNEASGTDRPKKKRRGSLGPIRRLSSVGGELVGNDATGAGGTQAMRKEHYTERQRKKLETYLQQLIRYHIFRPESNRLCKFLELSALGIRLAVEGGYHGKEGLLVIQSGQGVDFRKTWTPSNLKNRHRPKWFLVRQSYIVCVDSPEVMDIYDVFLVDSDFRIQAKKNPVPMRDQKAKELARIAKASATQRTQHHTLKVWNSERKMRLLARNERQLHQFEESLRFMVANTPWANKNRFDSFAPVRPNTFAQWLVDGRDYMWNLSRAISMAKDVILIHDWWLSPELYLRRPAAISQKWRLDRLLQRKAREGVKIFIIMYRNIDSAIPIDSEHSKFSLLDLHPNIFVQRSPNQMRQGTFFWAHHEKICVVDHMIAFIGGIDLCFGRWDTPQHELVDDKLTGFEPSDVPKDADHCQLWPGKDYSNPRVQDFYALDKPYEEMYDRSKVPRMPWHDIAMQVVGQPARDLARHFVQRWNYVLRQRKPTRPTPMLLPPPDFGPDDLEALGLNGTCEVQMLRSCSKWSMGTTDRVEHSILNAYTKLIEQSEHFVYIENQFFISSCDVENTRIENTIGDALVERITRAYQNDEDWRAIIIIPLLPGFQNTVDQQDGTSVRLIMHCQFRSINRGDSSIFGRLRAQNIEPSDYIEFFSLRAWGKIGAAQELVTEQLYIHAKTMVVDDRVAIIGSANINERSMLGSRDSECAAIVRDTDMTWSTMNGKPYLVGKFPHTLRMRLMREHLGIDVDAAMEEERQERAAEEHEQWDADMDSFHREPDSSEVPAADREAEERLTSSNHKLQDELIARAEQMHSFNGSVEWEQGPEPDTVTSKNLTPDSRSIGKSRDEQNMEEDQYNAEQHQEAGANRANQGAQSKINLPLLASVSHRRDSVSPNNERVDAIPLPPPVLPRMSSTQLGLPLLSQLPALPKTDDSDIGGPAVYRAYSSKAAAIINPVLATIKRPVIEKNSMKDPLNDDFYSEMWYAVAETNTLLFRTVFRCMPDNKVESWKDYKEYQAYEDRFSHAQGGSKSELRAQQTAPGGSGPVGQGTNQAVNLPDLAPVGQVADAAEALTEKAKEAISSRVLTKEPTVDSMEHLEKTNQTEPNNTLTPSETRRNGHSMDTQLDDDLTLTSSASIPRAKISKDPEITFQSQSSQIGITPETHNPTTESHKRRRRTGTRGSKKEFHASDDIISPADAEDLLNMVQGSLVLWPYDWLSKEEQGGNWLFSIDQLAPLEIYD